MNEAQEFAGIISFIIFAVGIVSITLAVAYAVAMIIISMSGL